LPDDGRLKRLRHAVLLKAEALKRSIDTETLAAEMTIDDLFHDE